MSSWVQMSIVSLASILASSGFWTFLQRRDDTKDAMARLLMGLAYDKIAQVGISYIERGWISRDEYEEFRKYLYEPYKAFGGNGVAERIMEEVSRLPLRSPTRYSQISKPRRNTTGRELQNGQFSPSSERHAL